jgi:hypothetical protein
MKGINDLIKIKLRIDADGLFYLSRADTGQLVDMSDVQMLKYSPVVLEDGCIKRGYYEDSFQIPGRANAVLLGEEYFEDSKIIAAGSYCILTEKPDDGIRRL